MNTSVWHTLRMFQTAGYGYRTRVKLLMDPPLPHAHGPISLALIDQLQQRAPRHWLSRLEVPLADADPYGLDLQLALYVCYELHYRGFAHVDDRWEWDGGLLHLRGQLEQIFLSAVRRDVGSADASAAEVMAALSVEPVSGWGPSHFLRERGTWAQMREYFVHRSLYHLKEGDPHAWAIPRLTGQAKASFVAVEFDEFGGGPAPGFINSCSRICWSPPIWTLPISAICTVCRRYRWRRSI